MLPERMDLKTNKGRKLLVIDGYQYRFVCELAGGTSRSYRCILKGCRGRGHTDAHDQHFSLRNEHSHEPDFAAVEVRNMRNVVYEAAAGNESSREIIARATRQLSADCLTLCPTYDSLCRTILRRRKSERKGVVSVNTGRSGQAATDAEKSEPEGKAVLHMMKLQQEDRSLQKIVADSLKKESEGQVLLNLDKQEPEGQGVVSEEMLVDEKVTRDFLFNAPEKDTICLAQEVDINNAVLIEAARNAMDRAFCPYSKCRVGAAILTKDGSIVTGGIVESKSFGATICAERSALVRAIAEGHTEFPAIAVVSAEPQVSPCGLCCQNLSEFGNMKILMASSTCDWQAETTLDSLYSFSFSCRQLSGSEKKRN